MIAYLDASVIVKRYVAEAHSEEVRDLIDRADALGTAAISRAEVSAALARAARMNLVTLSAAAAAYRAFEEDWENLVRLQITEALIRRAAALVWEHGLRGYDAVHLSAALVWRDALSEPVILATFDRELWNGGRAGRLEVWPEHEP